MENNLKKIDVYMYNQITLLCTWNIVSQLNFNKIYLLRRKKVNGDVSVKMVDWIQVSNSLSAENAPKPHSHWHINLKICVCVCLQRKKLKQGEVRSFAQSLVGI